VVTADSVFLHFSSTIEIYILDLSLFSAETLKTEISQLSTKKARRVWEKEFSKIFLEQLLKVHNQVSDSRLIKMS
jgi:hypothetical protein